MSDIKPQYKGNIGMFLVCAELSKLNLIAMPTSRNTKGYDIVVLHPDTNKALPIQVKCTDKKNFPILNSLWNDYRDKINEKVMSDFVFVDISELDKPRYFIVSITELKTILTSSIKKNSNKYGERHQQSWEEILEHEREEKRHPHLWAFKLVDIEAYENRWETIIDRLQD
jgi:hypothetical protein